MKCVRIELSVISHAQMNFGLATCSRNFCWMLRESCRLQMEWERRPLQSQISGVHCEAFIAGSTKTVDTPLLTPHRHLHYHRNTCVQLCGFWPVQKLLRPSRLFTDWNLECRASLSVFVSCSYCLISRDTPELNILLCELGRRLNSTQAE